MKEGRPKTARMIEAYKCLGEAERRRATRDMFYLAKWVLGEQFMQPGKPSLWLDKHEKLCRLLEGLWLTRDQRPWKTTVKVEWPRGTYKSTICTWAFPVWVMLREPNTRILIDSFNSENAQNFMAPIKETFENAYFQELFGDRRSPTNWNQESITLKRTGNYPQPTITCSGLNAEKTSQHYDLIIADDTQSEATSESREQIDSVIRNFKLYESLLVKGGMILNVGTRWAFDDLGEFIDKLEAADANAQRPKRIFISKYSAFTRNEEGKFTTDLEFPDILSKEELAHARATQGAFLFSCNYLCSPRSDETAVFKKEWLRYHTKSATDMQNANIYMTIDPAGEGTFAAADWNVIMIVAITAQYDIYVLHYRRGKWSREKLFRNVMEVWDYYKPRYAAVETVFQQHELAAWLKAEALLKGRPIAWWTLKTTQKTKQHRIGALQPYAEMGKLYLAEHTMRDLEDEMLQYPQGEHDDLLDSLAYNLEFMAAPAGSQSREYWKQKGWMEEWAKHCKPGEKPPTKMDTLAWAKQEVLAKKRLKVKRLMGMLPERDVKNERIRELVGAA
jgi:predicted phage terminase large subunit-like protein